MDLSTVYSKTAKGVQAITHKGKSLPAPLVRALGLVDGKATVAELLQKADEPPTSTLPRILADLARDGYLKTFARPLLNEAAIYSDSSGSMVVSETVDETYFRVLAETEARKNLMHEVAENPQKARQKAQEKAAAIAHEELMRRESTAREAAAAEEISLREAVQRKIAEAMAQEEAAIRARRKADLDAQQEKIAKLERDLAEAEERACRELQKKAAKEAEMRAAAERKAKEEAEDRVRQKAEQQKVVEAEARDQAEHRARKEAEEQALREKAEKENTAAEERIRKEVQERVAKEARIREAAERKAQEEAEEKIQAELSKRLRMEAQAREEAERKKEREREKAEAQAMADEKARAEARKQLRLEARAREEAERIKASEEAEAEARAEAEERKRLEAEAENRARQEAAEKARAEEEARAQAEAESRAREEAERKDREQAEAREKRAAEVRAIVAAEENAKAEEKARIKAETEAREKEEADRRARAEAEAKAIAEADEKARRKAEEKIRRQEEAQARALAEAEQKARAEAEQDQRERAEIEARARALADIRAVEAEKVRQKALAKPVFRRSIKLGKTLIIALAALILLPLVLLPVLSLNPFIPAIEKLASDRMREPVSIHSMHAALWPAPHLRLDGVAIGKLRDIKIPTVRVMPEMAGFFSETKTVKVIEVESLAIDQDALARVIAWVGPGGSADKIQVRRLAINSATLEVKGLPLPPFTADVALAATGRFEQANIRSADQTIEVLITRNSDGLEIGIAARDWQPPFWPKLRLTELRAKAMASSEGMRISEIDGRLYNGKAKGSATLKWGDLWSAEGDLAVENIVLAEAMPALTNTLALSGKLDAKTVFSMQARDLGTLFDAPRIKASFNVRDGSIGNIDLARAIQPQAMETTGGKTLFASLSGILTGDGKHYQYRQMKLAAGLLNAGGEADIMPSGRLSGKIGVEMKLKASTVRARLTLLGDLKQPVLGR